MWAMRQLAWVGGRGEKGCERVAGIGFEWADKHGRQREVASTGELGNFGARRLSERLQGLQENTLIG